MGESNVQCDQKKKLKRNNLTMYGKTKVKVEVARLASSRDDPEDKEVFENSKGDRGTGVMW